MSVVSLWPLGFFILVPGLVLLYILKQNAKEYTISSVELWQEVYRNLQATKPWERFRSQLLFFLQLFLLLLLIAALASPYLKKGGKNYGNVIFCIDNSGSMNGLYDGKQKKLDAAKEQAVDYINRYKPDTTFTVVAAGRQTSVVLSASSDKSRIKREIKSIPATDVAGNTEETTTMLRSLTSQLQDYEIVWFTDSDINLDTLQASVVDMSGVTEEAMQNVSLDYVSHTVRVDGGADILAKVTNHGNRQASGEVNLYLDEELLEVAEYELEPEESKGIYFNGLSAAKLEKALEQNSIIRAECNEADALLEDNTSYDFLSAGKEKNVLLVTKQNLFLEKAISINADVVLYKTNSVSHLDNTMTYDLYIFDGVVPEEVPAEGNLLYLNPGEDAKIGENVLFSVEGTEKNIWIDTKEHEVTDYLKDYTFGVSRLRKISRPAWAQEFFSAGEYSAGFVGDVEGRKVAVLGFDIHRTDFPLQTEFPIFMHNLLRECVDSTVLAYTKAEAGEPVEIRLSAQEQGTMTNPEGEKTKLEVSDVVYPDTEKSGLYQLVAETSKGEIKEYYFASFPAKESRLQDKISVTAKEGTKEVEKEATTISSGISLQLPVMLLVILLLLAEWWVYVRRT